MTETIKFTNLTGSYFIDFTEKQRQTLFGDSPKVRIVTQDESPEADLQGWGRNQVFDSDTRILTGINIDGINGKGYIQISRT